MKGILINPEKINELSTQSQKVLEEFLIINCLEEQECSNSLAKFLTYTDTVFLAENLLNTVAATPSTKVINQNLYYENLVGDKFVDLFGEAILEETRNALKKKDGYKVNPPMNILRRHNIWIIVDKYLLEEDAVFANELIDSLHANNFETMYLLENDSAKDIPLKWLELLLDCWLYKLGSNARIKQSFFAYFNYYMGLIECYEEKNGDCVKLEEYRAVAQESNVAKS